MQVSDAAAGCAGMGSERHRLARRRQAKRRRRPLGASGESSALLALCEVSVALIQEVFQQKDTR